MNRRGFWRGRRRAGASLGVLVAGLCLAPAAASDASAGPAGAARETAALAPGYGTHGYSGAAGSSASHGYDGAGSTPSIGVSHYNPPATVVAPAPSYTPPVAASTPWHGTGSHGGYGSSSSGSAASSSVASPSASSAAASSSSSATSPHLYGVAGQHHSGVTSASHGYTPASSASATTTTTATTPSAPASSVSADTATAAPTTVASVPSAAAGTPAAATTVTAPTAGKSTKRTTTSKKTPSRHASTTSRKRTTNRRKAAAKTARGGATVTAAAARRAANRVAATAAAARAAGSPASAAGPTASRRKAQPDRSPAPVRLITKELSQVPQTIDRLVPLPVPDWSKPIIFGLLVVCALLGLRARLTGRRARRLATEHRQLTDDLASIQTALIPPIPPRLGTLNMSVAYRPADGPGAGGDFYDAFPLERGRVAIILGDVSGHGRTALSRAAHMHYTLRAYVEMGLEPRAALKLAGRVLGAEEDDLFTTVAVAVHDPDAGTLTYATAGHPDPVLTGLGAHRPLTGSASPALGWGVPTGRRQTTVAFPAGATACFFTDGVTEARVDGELLGRDRLAQTLEGLDGTAAAEQLLERVRARAEAIQDDMAACIVRATEDGAAQGGHRVEELEVDVLQLSGGQGERFLGSCGIGADDAHPVLAAARRIAAESGVALLRVELTGEGASAGAFCAGSAAVSLSAPEPVAAGAR